MLSSKQVKISNVYNILCVVIYIFAQFNIHFRKFATSIKTTHIWHVYLILFLVPRSCVIDQDELKDGLRVLLFKDGLFYEGAVLGIRPPDVYGVIIDNARGNRPLIYSQEEILKDAVRI